MVAGLAVDIRPLIPAAVARGGHVRVGLEDAPLGTELTNVQWVEQAAAAIEQAGGQVATRRRGAPATSAVSRLTASDAAARRGWVAGPGRERARPGARGDARAR